LVFINKGHTSKCHSLSFGNKTLTTNAYYNSKVHNEDSGSMEWAFPSILA